MSFKLISPSQIQSGKMWFKSKGKVQVEHERKAREEANLRQMFFQMPVELRNDIYEMLLPSGEEIIKNGSRGSWYGPFPALLHTCRRLRLEVLPMFYGKNRVAIELPHLYLHPRALPRVQSCINLLPRDGDGIACMRVLRIESSSRCFHANGAEYTKVDAFVDRSTGVISCKRRYQLRSQPECCAASMKRYNARLSSEIRGRGINDGKRALRRKDFERLAIKMDENRSDWPKAPRRVIPKRFDMT